MNPHPLLPSSNFITPISLASYLQLYQSACPAHGIISSLAGSLLGSSLFIVPSVRALFFLPTSAARGLSNDNQKKFRKISFTFNMVSIVTLTLIAYKCYKLTSSRFIKGLILEIHSFALLLLAYAPESAASLGLISLRENIKNFIINENSLKKLPDSQVGNISEKADYFAAIIYAIFSLALTKLGQNPILATGTTYVLAAVAKPVGVALMMEYAMRVQRNKKVVVLN